MSAPALVTALSTAGRACWVVSTMPEQLPGCYQVVRALGLHLVPVADLPREALLITEHSIVLVRTDLDHEDHARVADWILDRALEGISRAGDESDV